MSQRLCRQLPSLVHWCQAPPELQHLITQHASQDLINTLCECVVNLFAGNLPMTPEQRRHLVPHTKMFLTLMKKKVSMGKKRKLLLQQKGKGALGALAGVAYSLYKLGMREARKNQGLRINGTIVRRPWK